MTTRRAGVSLVEVLAAIFIMGIGLVSIFTLFPYGAIQMASSLADDRKAQCAQAADAYMRWYWKEKVVEGGGFQESFVAAMSNPNADPTAVGGSGQANPNKGNATPALVATTDPSYPVYVDPMGWVARPLGGPDKYWVASSLLPRRNLLEIEQLILGPAPTFLPLQPPQRWQTYAFRTCSLLDAHTFAPGGQVADASSNPTELPSSGVVAREMRYNWAWVLQRPNNNVPSTARMTVVVYERANLFAPSTAEQVFAGTLPNPPGSGSTQVTFTGTLPTLKKGSWLLDATSVTTTYGSTPQPTSYIRNANFYKVVSAVENVAGTLDVELATPIKADTMSTRDPNGNPIVAPAGFNNQNRTFVVLTGVVDVFERNNLTASDNGP